MITATIKETKTEIKQYPYLGIYPNGEIVLFIKDHTGICLKSMVNNVGLYLTSWANGATPFTGELTLRNGD